MNNNITLATMLSFILLDSESAVEAYSTLAQVVFPIIAAILSAYLTLKVGEVRIKEKIEQLEKKNKDIDKDFADITKEIQEAKNMNLQYMKETNETMKMISIAMAKMESNIDHLKNNNEQLWNRINSINTNRT